MPVSQPIFASAFAAPLLDPHREIPLDVQHRKPKRYAVYRNNVTIALVRAMEANFPAIRRLLGEENFFGFAREFVQVHPPQLPLMFMYGDKFPDFLEGRTELTEFPYLGDVARLEQICRLAYHEADSPSLAAGDISNLDPEQLGLMVLKPHPALAFLQSLYSVNSILVANKENEVAHVDPTQPEWVVVTRPAFTVETRSVPEATFVFLQKLSGGEAFGSAAESAFALDPAFDLASGISTMMNSGAFQSNSLKG